MKFTAFIFVLLLVAICALPQDDLELDDGPARITVTNRIRRAVNNMNSHIVNSGLDPYHIPYWSAGVDTIIGSAYMYVKGLTCTGLSQNHFEVLNFNSVTMRLNFRLFWPLMKCELASQGAHVDVLGRKFEASKSGTLEMRDSYVDVSVRVRAKPISGISIIDCRLLFNTNVQSNLEVKWQGRDISDIVNWQVEKINQHIQDNKYAFGRQACEMIEQMI